jgi:hypothetical protein
LQKVLTLLNIRVKVYTIDTAKALQTFFGKAAASFVFSGIAQPFERFV